MASCKLLNCVRWVAATKISAKLFLADRNMAQGRACGGCRVLPKSFGSIDFVLQSEPSMLSDHCQRSVIRLQMEMGGGMWVRKFSLDYSTKTNDRVSAKQTEWYGDIW